ncbi:MAG: hypothetical protein JKY65_34310 [Planctomycetes bacterium]|nr:hypothetical protein [Planctomycetota bacterium]
MRKLILPFLFISFVTVGCVGGIRDTTTARSASEILLISTAAERAVAKYDASALSGKNVFIDDARFVSVDKEYVMSALRGHLAASGVTLVGERKPISKGNSQGADFVLELRNGTLGIWDGDFVLGIPALPLAAQGSPVVLTPPLYLFRRLSAQGYAKFQFWLYDAATAAFIGRSTDLWGHSFYNKWWWLGIGPFDGSNDIFPEVSITDAVTGE